MKVNQIFSEPEKIQAWPGIKPWPLWWLDATLNPSQRWGLDSRSSPSFLGSFFNCLGCSFHCKDHVHFHIFKTWFISFSWETFQTGLRTENKSETLFSFLFFFFYFCWVKKVLSAFIFLFRSSVVETMMWMWFFMMKVVKLCTLFKRNSMTVTPSQHKVRESISSASAMNSRHLVTR